MLALTLLLSLWTAWLLISVVLLGRAAGAGLAAGFLALWALLVFTTSLSWRNYLMIWLCVPMAIALGQVAAGERAYRGARLAAAAVSAAGLLWLWLAGGATHAAYVVAAALALLGAAVLSGLGFGLCWLYFCGPARQAQKTAESRRERAEQGAARAERRSTRTLAELEQAQRACHHLTAENARLRAARPAPPPGSSAGPARPASFAAPAATVQDPASLITVTCYALRDLKAERTGRHAQPAEMARLVVRREVAVAAQVSQPIEALRREYEQPGVHHEHRDAIREAVAHYAAQRVQGTVLVSLWQTEQAVPLADVAGLLDASAGWLPGLVADPLSGLVSGAGGPGPAAPAAAGRTANFAAAPVTTPLDKAARICELAGIVFGVATGLHPLVIASVRRLAYDEFGTAVAAAFGRAMTPLTGDGPAGRPIGRFS
ncbi:MAG TPA: hypothetical protein VMH35_23145 [Streptosporangiaceae bacterium]|nr:hypothetical protein [Streptosporangiaceae bacterium]